MKYITYVRTMYVCMYVLRIYVCIYVCKYVWESSVVIMYSTMQALRKQCILIYGIIPAFALLDF